MAVLVPPPSPPPVITGDRDGGHRYRMRTTQVIATMITVLIAAWLCTLGVIPAIIALMTAKHVLVAVLMMGLGVDKPRSMKGVP